VGAAALDLGAITGFLLCFNPREKIYDLCDYISGQRFHPDWTRVGGLMQDLRDEGVFLTLCRNAIEDIKQGLGEVEGLLNKNRIFIDRTQGIGVFTKDEAIGWSLTGPMARASGVARDIRKDFPYLCYQDDWDGQGAPAVKFRVPIALEGDAYARFRVRCEEIKESLSIIEQLLPNIPKGPVDTFADAKMVKPPKKDVYGSIEALIQHFELIMSNRGWKAPIAETYGCQESPNGEQGYYIVADGGPRAWRVRIRPPCFINYQVMQKMTEGHMLSDIPAVLGSINVVAAELDR
jgi:NADH-quinone oxidoreductase subunit D